MSVIKLDSFDPLECKRPRYEPVFPDEELVKFRKTILTPSWRDVVEKGKELECLLKTSINLCKKGVDQYCTSCQKFLKEDLKVIFTKMLNDQSTLVNAENGFEIQVINHCKYFTKLMCLKIKDDCIFLLEIFALILNPDTPFHSNFEKKAIENANSNSSPVYFLLKLFEKLSGFQVLVERFEDGNNLTIEVISKLLNPFFSCNHYLDSNVIKQFFVPIAEIVNKILLNIRDSKLKKEKSKGDHNSISTIVRALKQIASHASNQKLLDSLEETELQIALRLLLGSKIEEKLIALKELDAIISNLNHIRSKTVAAWIRENFLIERALDSFLDNKEYTSKLENILRLGLKEHTLNPDIFDLLFKFKRNENEDANVDNLLIKIFSDMDMDYQKAFFRAFKMNYWDMTNCVNQKSRLLDFIQEITLSTKAGYFTIEVLKFLLDLIQVKKKPIIIAEKAFSIHKLILKNLSGMPRNLHCEQREFCFEEKLLHQEITMAKVKITTLKNELESVQKIVDENLQELDYWRGKFEHLKPMIELNDEINDQINVPDNNDFQKLNTFKKMVDSFLCTCYRLFRG